MSGERQPGGRPPAPGELALVQAFINSHYDLEFEHGGDLLATPEALAGWLRRHGLVSGAPAGLTGADVRRAVALREGLRGLAAAGAGAGADGTPACPPDVFARLNEAAAGATVEINFGPVGPRYVPAGATRLDRALAVVVASTAAAVTDGSWSRLKICPGEDCGWAFYDHSRNQSGRWCSMRVCGGRAKARAHFRRQRQAEH